VIAGVDNYDLSDQIIFSVTSQKFKFELHKNFIATERFIIEPNSV